MELRAVRLVLFVTVFLPTFVLSDTQEKSQEFWKKKGQEELEAALNLVKNEKQAKNVIFFLADGMGPNTLTAARIYSSGEGGSFSFEKFPHVGILKTYAVDRTVPDSACTATALFTGVKSNFETSGVDGNVKLKDCKASLNPDYRLDSIVDWAHAAGKDTGFITTTRVTHATPSALYSHTAYRKWECEQAMPKSANQCKDIARQLIEDEPGRSIKVIMGGGRQCLTWNFTSTPEDPLDDWTCHRQDGRDLISTWQEDKIQRKATYKVLRNSQDLESLDTQKTDFVLGVFANSFMPYEDVRNKTPQGTPSLSAMTTAAIKTLQKSKNGYVLMVEGGMIDQAHHRGNARRALEEVVQLDEAVAAALKLISDDTLVILTSDHSHNLNINGNTPHRNNILGIAMNSKADGVPYTTLTYSTGGSNNFQFELNESSIQRKDPSTTDTKSYTYSQQAGILNDEATHGGADVAIFAKGPMAHLFHGMHEQSYVAHVIAYAAKIGKHRGDATGGASSSTQPTLLIVLISLSLLLFS